MSETNIVKKISGMDIDYVDNLINIIAYASDHGVIPDYELIAILANIIAGTSIKDTYSIFGIKRNNDNSMSSIIRKLRDLSNEIM